jgi:hypothetical protein
MKNLLYILPFAVVLFISCTDDDEIDTTSPSIEVSSPVDYDVFSAGESIYFSCYFSDNKELASYKIEIHSNFDDHDHESTSGLKSDDDDDDDDEFAWSYTETITFDAAQTEVFVDNLEIQIPETITSDGVEDATATGEYHFGVYVTDASGNESSVFIDIDLE